MRKFDLDKVIFWTASFALQAFLFKGCYDSLQPRPYTPSKTFDGCMTSLVGSIDGWGYSTYEEVEASNICSRKYGK